jgi:hypothetical protein
MNEKKWVWLGEGSFLFLIGNGFDWKWVRNERCFSVDSMFNFGFSLLIHVFLFGLREKDGFVRDGVDWE